MAGGLLRKKMGNRCRAAKTQKHSRDLSLIF
jgi:hypothetical protein